MENFIANLSEIYEVNRNQENATAMEQYMKNLFPFLGIRSPERKAISADWLKSVGVVPNEALSPFIKELWGKPEREYQYIALDYLVKKKKYLLETDIELMEYLIVTKSWWDTVDLIASHLVGELFSKHPHLIKTYGEKWIASDNMWLQRTMILFQLKYKNKTDEQLLYSYISRTSHIDEFFIQKAIGWSLREYSKTNPEAVAQFIETHELSNLARREGSKYVRVKS
ncbi:DNA alkylation repair protein [Lederbergia wuyishanensis]|uniref:3-methyladenine DNA glycosylase AlkD n=1 Tax=Lederbergia wuyishanensis TaxID=1347903 RepID=A0ABU0D6U7_9BACI|nr:DNA alkylation repair protein [Lederbergia wuyishanensis]MCJ8008816.1 DNA alkylation repair protein [Lederbergia wuyishanensis]MDQ0344138.1 3-methyladenine DNA glycosylase AlkD [Lederbergia wuyishanensis]